MPTILDRPLPEVSLLDSDGVAVSPATLGGPLFLLVVAPGCQPCDALLAATSQLLERVASQGVKVLLVLRSADDRAIGELRRAHGLSPKLTVLRDIDGITSDSWDIQTTPTAVLVDAEMRVKSVSKAPTAEWIVSVIGRSDQTPEKPTTAPRSSDDTHLGNRAAPNRMGVIVTEVAGNG
jgi:thiol-disulfide isomerase/thioredoxin